MKRLILFLGIALAGYTTAAADQSTYSTYYPAPFGRYINMITNQLLLTPMTTALPGSCTVGTLVVNSANQLQYCTSPTTWNALSGIWGQDKKTSSPTHNYLFPTDYGDTALKVGIGTNTPQLQLHLSGNGGIVADKGDAVIGGDTLGLTGAGIRFIFYPKQGGAIRAGRVSGVGANLFDDSNIKLNSVAFGYNNEASANYATVGGGSSNKASYQTATVAGGNSNSATALSTTVAGGDSNTASGMYASVGGGLANTADHQYGRVSGGFFNKALADEAFIGGGETNTITSTGIASTISGGSNNSAAGAFAAISGGTYNHADGDNSWAGGSNMQLSTTADGTFAWGQSGFPQSIATPNSFLIFPKGTAGNAGIGTDNPQSKLDVVGNIGLGNNGAGASNLFAMGAKYNVRVLYGYVSQPGVGNDNTVFTVNHFATGKYRITFVTPFTNPCFAVANSIILSSAPMTISLANVFATSFEVWSYDYGTGSYTDVSFNWIAIGTR